MKSQSMLRGLLVFCLLGWGQAGAVPATYTYTGVFFPAGISSSGGTVTATVVVDYVNAGTYKPYGTNGITTISLTAGWDNPDPAFSFTLNAPDSTVIDNDANYPENYLVINEVNGVTEVTEWSIGLTQVDVDNSFRTIWTLGKLDANAGGQLFKYFVTGPPESNFDNSVAALGEWTNAIPEPATLSLIGLALVGIGVSRRRKQK